MNYLQRNDRKYKMFAKMLWPLMQVNLPLMFYVNEIPISSQKHKKRLYDFMTFFTATLRPFIKYHSPLPPLFPSRNITKNAKTHPPSIHNVIIKQPLQTMKIWK